MKALLIITTAAFLASSCSEIQPYVDRAKSVAQDVYDKAGDLGIEVKPTPDRLPGDKDGS